jgi:hypothetical protein
VAETGVQYRLVTPGGTLTFNPSPSNQDGLYLEDVQGLDGGGVRGAVVPLSQRDGAVVFDSYRDAAYPTLTGFIRASTVAARTTIMDSLKGLTDSLRFADGQLQWLPSGAVYIGSASATLSGNEITDAVRTADVQGDGRAVESSVGFYKPATNLLLNGGCEVDPTGWAAKGSATLTRDAAHVLFGQGALKVVTGNVSNPEGAQQTVSGLSPLTAYSLSVWVWGASGTVRLSAEQIAGGVTQSTTSSGTITLASGWQQLTLSLTTGVSCDSIKLRVETPTTQAASFWVDGAQLETGLVPTPYVNTAGQPNSRLATRAQFPASLLGTPSQGWAAFRVRVSRITPVGDQGVPALFIWGSGSTYIDAYLNTLSNTVRLRRSNGAGIDTFDVAHTFSAGELITVVVAWDATNLYVSINGGAFTSLASPHVPAIGATTFDLGSTFGTDSWLNGDVFWSMFGSGTLSGADLTALNALGNTDPADGAVSAGASMTARWSADTSTYRLAGVPDWRQVNVRLIGAVQIGNGAGVMKSFQVQLVAANPVSVSTVTRSIAAGAFVAGGGLVLPFSLPFSFGDPTAGVAVVTPNGNVAAYPVVAITGPIAAPTINNLTTGKRVSFPTLSVAAGDVLTVDMLNELAYVNGPANSKIGLLDYGQSDFWALTAQVSNAVQVTGQGTTAQTAATVTFNDSYV